MPLTCILKTINFYHETLHIYNDGRGESGKFSNSKWEFNKIYANWKTVNGKLWIAWGKLICEGVKEEEDQHHLEWREFRWFVSTHGNV